MRVLWLAINFPAGPDSPIGTYNWERAQALRRSQDVEVKVVSPVGVMPPESLARHPSARDLREWWAGVRAPRFHEWLDGIEVWRPRWVYPPKRWFWRHEGAWLARQTEGLVRRVVDEFRPDLLQASRLFPEGKALVRLGRRLGLPVVAVAEGSEVMIWLPRDADRHRLVRELNTGADALVYVSGALRDRAHSQGLKASIEAVVYNGVDTARFSPGDPSLGECEPTVLTVGNLQKVKGHDLLIRSLGLLASRYHLPCRLVIVGDGPERDALCRLAKDLGLADSVLLVGSVSNRDLPGYLRSARVMCLPSRSEGLGVAAIEAMSCGVPVVATHVGGLPEVIDEPTTGILVDPESPDALAAGVASALSRQWDAALIRDSVRERFSIERSAQGFASVYDQVLVARSERRRP